MSLFEMNETGLTVMVQEQLGKWLIEHEAGQDSKFVDYLNERSAKTTS